MSENTPLDVLTRQEHAEAIVIRIGVRMLLEGEEFAAVRDAVYSEAEIGNRPLILDLTAVEYLSSAACGLLIKLRRQLMKRGKSFQPPCRRRGLFAFFRDQMEALEAIRRGELDPLLLCGVSPNVKEIFEVC